MTGHGLFVHGLTEMMDVEQRLVEALRELENDSTDTQLKEAFASHCKETEEHVKRLEKCFDLLSEALVPTECKGIRGIIEEKKDFMEEAPSPDILDAFHIGAASKAETYEICEYESLIQMSQEMGHTKVSKLLRTNLKDERAALKKLKSFSKKVKPNNMMDEGQEEAASSGARSKPAA